VANGGAGQANVMYKNNGDGTFSNATSSTMTGDTGVGYATAYGDYDNDGDMDLYVVNYYAEANVMYKNNGSVADLFIFYFFMLTFITEYIILLL